MPRDMRGATGVAILFTAVIVQPHAQEDLLDGTLTTEVDQPEGSAQKSVSPVQQDSMRASLPDRPSCGELLAEVESLLKDASRLHQTIDLEVQEIKRLTGFDLESQQRSQERWYRRWRTRTTGDLIKQATAEALREQSADVEEIDCALEKLKRSRMATQAYVIFMNGELAEKGPSHQLEHEIRNHKAVIAKEASILEHTLVSVKQYRRNAERETEGAKAAARQKKLVKVTAALAAVATGVGTVLGCGLHLYCKHGDVTWIPRMTPPKPLTDLVDQGSPNVIVLPAAALICLLAGGCAFLMACLCRSISIACEKPLLAA
eukprot:gnl/TRDRNA2_/TRDRNA2_162236_c0_seq1.p1 gnl/TRDRNA2_/TRDRNA2_162236_c0~~gnl/TRDRNA2_/TRDRNA2_162236_c0_seq1.p1  ORF type:complete len:318 (+),score=36.98 gnl/TRDRNA2_/TRDRNA2_162236_c0_seq1:56-1009(+)